MMARSPRRSREVMSSRAQGSEGRMPSTPPMPKMYMHSTLEPRELGPFAQQVPIRSNYTPKPTTKTLDAREEASAYFLGRMIHDTRRVRPANFQSG